MVHPKETSAASAAGTTGGERRVVCAAIRQHDLVICSARHYDSTMRAVVKRLGFSFGSAEIEQGFVDQHGVFMNREEALGVARAAGQIRREVGGGGTRLFSEMLY